MRFGIAFTALAVATACEQRTLDDVQQTRTSARAVQRAAETWRAQHPERCPTVDLLHRDKHLDRAEAGRDAWGRELVIQCRETVQVRSSGPDRSLDTTDDIVVP